MRSPEADSLSWASLTLESCDVREEILPIGSPDKLGYFWQAARYEPMPFPQKHPMHWSLPSEELFELTIPHLYHISILLFCIR